MYDNFVLKEWFKKKNKKEEKDKKKRFKIKKKKHRYFMVGEKKIWVTDGHPQFKIDNIYYKNDYD